MGQFPDEDGGSCTKIQHQHVAHPMRKMYGGGVRSCWVVGVQGVTFHSVHERDNLVGTPHIDVVVQASVTKKLHTHPRREVERGVCAQQSPDTE